MCGFVGCFDLDSGSAPIAEGLKEELRAQVLEMSKKIRHRGPDWSGVYTGNNAILSHERLSMVDTCAGEFDAETPYFYSTTNGLNEAEYFINEKR